MKLAKTYECTACMACLDSCSHKALDVVVDKDGFYKIVKDNNNCVECGLCSKICPIINPISIDKKAVDLSTPNATWCKDVELRSKAASGGAFAALAKVFLQKGGIVYGASINGFEIKHKRIECIEDLPSVLGSKYQASVLVGIYKQVKDDLRKGKHVLFSGLSCQVAGVLKYVGTKLATNLYTVDTICGGISTMLPMLDLKRKNLYLGIESFRNKDTGWKSTGFQYALRMISLDGSIVDLGMENAVIKNFCSKVTKRSSCYDCKYNGFHRISDCTIGDLWGDRLYPDQHQNGLSLIVVHSDRIKKFIEESSLIANPIKWHNFIDHNPCYYWSHAPYKRYSVKRFLILHYLRYGKFEKANKLLQQYTLTDRIESKIFGHSNELMRQEFVYNIIDKNNL